jgi:putative SOS response-associated peptidase YedK
MCGRFAFDADVGELTDRFAATAAFDRAHPSFNVTPGSFMPIIIRQSPNRAIRAKWGLVPSWAKDPAIGYKMINARAEGIDQKPSFRASFKSKRCLVPTTGFFEWKHIGKDKVPYFIHVKKEKLFAFAGLYSEWKDAEGVAVPTFTIITTEPNTLMESIHNRMPVILDKKDEETWLNPAEDDTQKLLGLLNPYPATHMEAYVVSKRVNNPRYDDPDIVAPADEQTDLF